MTSSTRTWIIVIGIAVVLYLVTQHGGRGAFTGTNVLPNADIESWNAAASLPTGWISTGYGGTGQDLTLLYSTTPVHLGGHSVTFNNKGYIDGSGGTCPNWCIYLTDAAPVTPGSTINARFHFYPTTFVRGSGTDGVRVYVRFYNGVGLSLPAETTGLNFSGKLPTLAETRFANQTWQDLAVSGIAPEGAASARMRVEIATGATADRPKYAATFTLDDMWIESESTTTCESNWDCPNWDTITCVNGVKTRTCTDLNHCDPENPPAERTRSCSSGANSLPNPDVEDWNGLITNGLPLGWTTIKYADPTVLNLTQSTTPVHLGGHSVTFVNKGYINGSITSCPNWCIYETDNAPVTPGTPILARLFFQPSSFTRRAGSDGVRVKVSFYDAGHVALPSTPYWLNGPILSESSFANQGWQELSMTGTVPVSAAYAKLRFEVGTQNSSANQFAATFTLDDMWIESSYVPPPVCTSNWNYTAWSACSGGQQTRTATDLGNCTTPNPPADVTSRVCSNIYERIDEYKAGMISMQTLMGDIATYRTETQPPTAPDPLLVMLFDNQLAAYPNIGTGYNRFAQADSYGWSGTNAVDALLTMYEATKDIKYLTQARTGIEAQYQGGVAGIGTDSAQQGNVMAQFTRFTYLVRRYGITTYFVDADRYYNFAVTNYLTGWNLNFKSFNIGGQDMGCFVNYDNNWVCDRWNAASGMALSFLYAHLYQANSAYLDKAIRHATFFKTWGLQALPGCSGTGYRYSWGYRAENTGQPGDVMPIGTGTCGATTGSCAQGTVGWGRYDCGCHEEDHYAQYELRMAYVFWEHDLVFTDANMAIFAQTFKEQLNTNTANPSRQDKIDCWSENGNAAQHNAFETGYIEAFAKYAHLDPTLEAAYRVIVNKVTSTRDAGPGNLGSSGNSQYYQCVLKAGGTTPVCWDGDSTHSPPCTYPCRVVIREMIMQDIADLTYSTTKP